MDSYALNIARFAESIKTIKMLYKVNDDLKTPGGEPVTRDRDPFMVKLIV